MDSRLLVSEFEELHSKYKVFCSLLSFTFQSLDDERIPELMKTDMKYLAHRMGKIMQELSAMKIHRAYVDSLCYSNKDDCEMIYYHIRQAYFSIDTKVCWFDERTNKYYHIHKGERGGNFLVCINKKFRILI